MGKRDWNDVTKLIETIESVRALEQKLEETLCSYAGEGIAEAYSSLEEIAVRAQQNQDTELLQQIFHNVIPEIGKVNTLCQNIWAFIEEAKPEELNLGLLNKQVLIEAMRPNSLLHISADTTKNAGDFILVRSLKKLVEDGIQKEICWSEYGVRDAVTDDFIEACNKSRGIIMGGGGFFLRDTNENNISGWQWPCTVEDMKRINTPIYVLGVGYNRFRGQEEFEPCFTESLNTLVERSAFFGLRNYGSIRAVQSYLRDDLKEKVKYHPCATTVLAKMYELPKRGTEEPFIAVNCAFDRANLRFGDRQDEIMTAIANVCKKLSEKYKIKCYLHCPTDAYICGYLDAAGVTYEPVLLAKRMSVNEYLKYFTEPELVLAMRGHGQMIPFGCKTPVVSIISHDKLKWFLDDIEHPEWGADVLDEQFEDKLLECSVYMLENREQICKEIEVAQDRLWDVMQENLKNIMI